MTDAPLDPLAVIDSTEQLLQLLDVLGNPSLLALDTEFHSERRYRPELLLVQLAVRGGPVWTVDPRTVDLSLLRPMLESATWLVHGGSSDVRLMHSATGACPPKLMDTQLLAAFAGMPHPARLSDLVREVLGRHVDKGATLSDWSRRPLTEQQLAYARADVEVLFPLMDSLHERIDALDAASSTRRGRDWAAEAGQELAASALAPRDPDAQWRQLEIAPRFDGPTRLALQTLYAWREEEAQRRNTPPHFVLAPSIALDLARRRPRDLDGLRANRRFPQGLLKRHGRTLIRLLEIDRTAAAHPPPVAHPPPGKAAMLRALRPVLASESHIAPSLLLPERRIEQIAVHGSGVLSGWRRALVGDIIEAVLAGRCGLRLVEDHVLVEPYRDNH